MFQIFAGRVEAPYPRDQRCASSRGLHRLSEDTSRRSIRPTSSTPFSNQKRNRNPPNVTEQQCTLPFQLQQDTSMIVYIYFVPTNITCICDMCPKLYMCPKFNTMTVRGLGSGPWKNNFTRDTTTFEKLIFRL